MVDYRSNDPRVELAMDQIYIALSDDPFGNKHKERMPVYATLDFVTQALRGIASWEVSVRIKRPYTYVQVTHEGRTACAFGKVNWTDKFSMDTGFAIVARKALAAYYKKEIT